MVRRSTDLWDSMKYPFGSNCAQFGTSESEIIRSAQNDSVMGRENLCCPQNCVIRPR